MSKAWESLVPRLTELADLGRALGLLQWDQAVMMPPRGGPSRARVVATLESEAHKRLTDPAIGSLLDDLRSDDSLDERQKATVRVLNRDHSQATKLPEELVRDIAEMRGLAYQAWTQARPASDFSILEPHLARFVELKRREADALGWEAERYDALLDLYEPGTTTADVSAMFSELTEGLEPIARSALDRADRRAAFLFATFDPAKQQSFCRWLVERLGFDTDGGRLDESPHPFTIRVGLGDVRQTTRTQEQGVLGAVYAAIHETGHALYEQGIPSDMLDLPVGRVPSLGMHESQSRLWENHVGRSRAFTDFMLPHLKERFPDEMGMVTPEDFYRGVNAPQRSLIRVSADELTYNLHVALRFELEVGLFRDELEVSDLPAAWNDGMERYLGIRPDDDASGVLQDMHWSIGAYGYFPTYTIGTIYAAAIFDAAARELGGLDEELRAGEPARLLGWLRSKVHSQAYLYDAKDLIARVVGHPVGARPLLGYLEDKYSRPPDSQPSGGSPSVSTNDVSEGHVVDAEGTRAQHHGSVHE
jgi:carboxypeptidase Taq